MSYGIIVKPKKEQLGKGEEDLEADANISCPPTSRQLAVCRYHSL